MENVRQFRKILNFKKNFVNDLAILPPDGILKYWYPIDGGFNEIFVYFRIILMKTGKSPKILRFLNITTEAPLLWNRNILRLFMSVAYLSF